MSSGSRWTVLDRESNEIYLTHKRWKHIVDEHNHPEMGRFEEQLQQTVQTGRRKQDLLNPRKYRYTMECDALVEDNTHIVAIVLFRFSEDHAGRPIANNYVVTAYQKEIG